MNDDLRFETKVIHAGEPSPRIGGALVPPIFQSSVFEQPDGASYDDLRYPRLNNLINHRVIGDKLAALEGAEAGLVTASGMAAITTALLESLKGGGHLLAQDCLYGGTHSFVTRDLPALGASFDFIDVWQPDTWRHKLRPNTRAIYVETMTNPLLQVADHRAVVGFAREHGLVSLIDNTFASPVNFRPPEFGYDVSLHSCTKYLNGHSDLAAGAVVGSRERVTSILHLLNHLGGSLDPHACFLLHRGMKTLVLRVRQQNANALAIARWLRDHPRITRVNHPGLEEHPQHALAREWFDGFGGMLSFEIDGGARAAKAMLDRVRIPLVGPSLGGVETLLTRPAATSHAGLTPAERDAIGVREGLVRMSVGIESPDDLIADLEQALGPG
jgi:cystathionine beta-lyase/cystathionine gamma-synthase